MVDEKASDSSTAAIEKLDNLENFYYDYSEDPDEVVQEFMDERLPWEVDAGLVFSKNGIIKHVEAMLAKEHPDVDPRWELKLKSPTIVYYLKKGCSDLNKT